MKIFGEEKTIFWREAADGHSRLAYYIGKSISALYRVILGALHFTAIFYFLGSPITPFSRIYQVIFGDFFCVYGMAAIVSMLVRRENASLLAVVVCLFAGVFSGFGPSLSAAKGWGAIFIWYLSYGTWGSEALYGAELEYYSTFYQTSIGADAFGYELGRVDFDVGMMILLGFSYRIVAFFLLLVTHRDKQK